jgi:radical SAM protein with 4Fe4S-binding SPASM domain
MEPSNDFFRQKEGAFKLSLEGIRNCRDLGLQVGLRFTLTRYNFRDLEKIFQLMLKESIPRLCIYHLVYSGKGFELKNADLSASERKQALEIIWKKTQSALRIDKKIEILTVDNHCDGIWIYLKLREENPALAEKAYNLLQVQGGNASGVKIIAVDNCGNVYPDQFWRTYCLGNIREKKLSQILQDENNSLLRSLRERKKLLKGKCSRCSFLNLCNGNLRARAEAVFQDPWEEDPACYFSREEIVWQ